MGLLKGRPSSTRHHKSLYTVCTPPTTTTAMNSMLILSALVACAAASLVVPGPVAVRAPSHDSAIIQSHRLGGNFAYSTHEAHAYAVQTPVIGQRTVPVGVSYHHGVPVVKTSTDYITHKIPQVAYTYPKVAVQAAVPQVATYAAGLPLAGTYAAGLPLAGPYGAVPYPYAAVVAAKPDEAAAEEA
ncbi:pupal cuticle protein G1A-like [Penaeus monodon]|uniref:pupal cuticle protein G1A-like n=1 Tax=Penaeus monodon TaxID=6687 RepID=UPI0018A76065|nr:pupal cuticle protein G1A-like [Penaeus monodon]